MKNVDPSKEPEIQSSIEIYDGKVQMGEVYASEFIAWYNWRMTVCPDMGAGIMLNEFDLDSAILFFEDWIKDVERLRNP